jgi:restriction system protein
MAQWLKEIAELTPSEFEEHVREMLGLSGCDLSDLRITRREVLQGAEGGYEIDVIVRFSALNANFVVLVECKHHKSPIKRDVVQVLFDRIRSTGAHKGIVFATSTFQRGAIEYAKQHGIALVKVTDSEPIVYNRHMTADEPIRLPATIRTASWLVSHSDAGSETYTRMGLCDPSILLSAFGRDEHLDQHVNGKNENSGKSESVTIKVVISPNIND